MKLTALILLSLGIFASVQSSPRGAVEQSDATGFRHDFDEESPAMRLRRRLKGSKGNHHSSKSHHSGSKGHSPKSHSKSKSKHFSSKHVSSKCPPPTPKPVHPPTPKPVHPPTPKPVHPPTPKPVHPPTHKPVNPPAPKPVHHSVSSKSIRMPVHPPPTGKGKGKGYWPPPPPPGKGKGKGYWPPPPPEGKGKGKGYWPPPPPPAGKGKGKGYWPPPPPEGKGKGKGYWPPPPPEGKGKGKGYWPPPPPPEGKGKGKGKGYWPPPPPEGKGKGKGKGSVPPNGKGKGKGYPPAELKCEDIQVTFYKSDLRSRYSSNAVGSTYDAVPFYSSDNGQLIGYYSDEATNLTSTGTECIGTSAYTFGPEQSDQINLQYTCEGEYNAITGGSGSYGCATGYETQIFEDKDIARYTLVVCGPLCPYEIPTNE